MTVVPGDRLTFGWWLRMNVLPLLAVVGVLLAAAGFLAVVERL